MDIIDLREFYGSRLGTATRRMIAHRLRARISMPAATIMGLGFATPYLGPQLHALLREPQSSPIGWSQALFMPPFERSLVLNSAPAWERLGLWVSPAFSGVIIVEAVKQIYAVSGGKRVRKMMPKLTP